MSASAAKPRSAEATLRASNYHISAAITALMQAPAKIEPKVGGVYSIYDGAITGEFVRVEHEHIELKWRMKNWAPDCFSNVVIKNTPRGAFPSLAMLAV